MTTASPPPKAPPSKSVGEDRTTWAWCSHETQLTIAFVALILLAIALSPSDTSTDVPVSPCVPSPGGAQ